MTNDMTLHTGEGCSITNNGAFSGSLVTTDCWNDDPNQSANAGCQIAATNTDTFGSGFNANGGGVYATEWTDSAISVFFFPRGSIPSDITSGSPDPSGWGTPLAQFQGGCDISTTFTNQQIVFDTTFCGGWAGNVWSTGSCASVADTCEVYVENHPEAFTDAYWSVNTLQVYQTSSSWSNVAVSSAVSSSSSSTSVAAPSSVLVSVAENSSLSISVAVPSSVLVSVAESSTSFLSPTTFAFSTKPLPLLSTSVPKTPPALAALSTYYAGNAANGTYPTGSGTGSIGTMPLSASLAPVPSSPPETISTYSSSYPSPTTTTSATTTTAHSYGHTWSHHSHGHEPSPAAVKRHLRHHKRHGAA